MPTQLDISNLRARLDSCMIRDRHRLARRLRGLQQAIDTATAREEAIVELAADIDRSTRRHHERISRRPKPTFPEALPVVQRKSDIAELIAKHQVVVLCGETGSGKTTQLPKICLELGRGVGGMIGHTQPRRVAARSVATRIADELGVQLGHEVGYKVRFGDRTSNDTFIKVMTDGTLLAELESDRFLDAYDTLIIDEAHERSLNIDFLLGYLKTLLPKRPDLKLIITSATINPEQFSKHFDNAPIIEVSGRTYPVELRYRPLKTEDPEEEDQTQIDGILSAVDELWREGPGDVLVFLTGEREIRETAEALSKHHPPGVEILPLYARLSADEQMRVFQSHQHKRIVLATNVAETSLTVPGIQYVIDPGHARISRYSARTKVQRLPVERVSRASADQRKGRCGRTGPGICIRLYSEDDFQARPEFTDPEILRTNLASVILQMKAQRLGDLHDFPFVEPPDYRMVRDGYQTLAELGAVDATNDLTRLGREISRLPVDPRIARMLLEANHEGCLTEMLIVASLLSVQDPRERPIDQAPAADEAHAQWRDPQSDFLGILKLWAFFRDLHQKLSHSKLRKAAKQNFLSWVRMREWTDVHAQLKELVSEFGWRINSRPANYDEIHRAILSGLLSNIGTKAEKHEYEGARGTKFSIFPGSSLFGKGPRWLMAAEIVQTTKLYARTVALIKPEWVERLAEHLVKRTYSEPQWIRPTASVAAYEKVTLYGLVIVPRRRVHYGPIEPKISREIFIMNALVEGEYDTDAVWKRHNDQLIRDVQLLEAKARSRNLLTDIKSRYDFYDRLVPAGVYSGALFEEWRKVVERQNRRALFMSQEHLLVPGAQPVTSDQFPDEMSLESITFPLWYTFDPSDPADGVTAVVPLNVLNQLSPEPFDWLVPGMLREKCVELIRTLPRQTRVNLVPAPDYAAKAVAQMIFRQGVLTSQLAWFLGRESTIHVEAKEFDPNALPDHLKMNFQIIDEAGEPLAMGRDLYELRQRLDKDIKKLIAELPDNTWRRDGIRTWDLPDLPEQIEIRRPGITMKGYPSLIDNGNDVSLRLLDTPEAARKAHRLGVRRLFLIEFRDDLSKQMQSLRDVPGMSLLYARLGNLQDLKTEIRTLIADRLLGDDPASVRTHDAFRDLLGQAWNDLYRVSMEVQSVVGEVLKAYQEASLEVSKPVAPLMEPALADVRQQLAGLVYKGFITNTPWVRLKQLPRYLKAIVVRLQKLKNAGLAKDQQHLAVITPLLQSYRPHARRYFDSGMADDADLELLRWMFEELRISMFAQELKTSIPVSTQRVEQQLERVKSKR